MPTEGDFRDQTLTCRDCERSFEFKAGEQKFFHERGLQTPKRCKDCRAAKKAGNEARERGQQP